MKNFFLSVCLLSSYFGATSQNDPVGLLPGQTAPDFAATDQNGKNINLNSALKKGKVVLLFYRGEWCPYCNQQLKTLEDSLSYIVARGASVIAITPEKPESITKTIKKTNASYSIIHDKGLTIMNSYGVSFKVDDQTIEKYKKYEIDFNTINGEANGANLPVPALYIIGKDGKIKYRYFDKNYRKRASIKEILSNL